MLACTVRKEDQGLKKVPFGCPAGQLDFLAGRETLEGHLHCSPMANSQGSHIVVTECLVFVAEGFVSNLSQTTNQKTAQIMLPVVICLSFGQGY